MLVENYNVTKNSTLTSPGRTMRCMFQMIFVDSISSWLYEEHLQVRNFYQTQLSSTTGWSLYMKTRDSGALSLS